MMFHKLAILSLVFCFGEVIGDLNRQFNLSHFNSDHTFLDPSTSGLDPSYWLSKKRPSQFSERSDIEVPFEFQCTSEIYCEGELLRAVQMSGLFRDSKTFVDMPTKVPEAQVLESFQRIANKSDPAQLLSFIDENFLEPGYEMEDHTPTDWKHDPTFLDNISDPKLIPYAKDLHEKWKSLVRIYNRTKLCDGCVVSSLHAAYPFVVPGGRFREFYYWDSYWIIEGLIVSEMWETVRGHILNMLEAIKVFGFIPNGFRVYYLNRSQPPLLAQMINIYYENTGDASFVLEALPALDLEYDFWMKHRYVDVMKKITTPDGNFTQTKSYKLNAYRVRNLHPRPESYIEDWMSAKEAYFSSEFNENDVEDDSNYAESFYANIASGAESGWDFTSRWLRKADHLRSIDIWNIVPVDLNAIMAENERILANFHRLAEASNGTSSDSLLYNSRFYEKANSERIEAIQNVLWNPQELCWLDYNVTANRFRSLDFHISNLSPLWFNAYNPNLFSDSQIMEMLNRLAVPLLSFPGGVPTSLTPSKQQWDYPNVWAPLEFYLDKMYENLQHQRPTLAETLQNPRQVTIQRWISTTYCGWKHQNGTFYEKYDATKLGVSGFGGEYEVQDGFGWTNGVALSFLKHHGHLVKSPISCDISSHEGVVPHHTEDSPKRSSTQLHGEEVPVNWSRAVLPIVLLIVLVSCGLFYYGFSGRSRKTNSPV